MDTQRLKQDAGGALKWLAEGWRAISHRAANALTYFTPSHGDDSPAPMRWGLLAVDVAERGDGFVIELEAPGLDKDAIDVTVEDHSVIVTATKHYESERSEGPLHISERAFGSFQRVIPLPARVSAEGAKASYKRGVLTLKIARAAPPGSRKVPISAA